MSSPSGQTLEGPTLVFCFGSNSTAQLRARVKAESLAASKASLPGWTRIFVDSAKRWGGGGVASIHPEEGSVIYGSVVALSPGQLDLLDTFEEVYDRTWVKVRVFGTAGGEGGGEGEERDAVAYRHKDPAGMPFIPPSEQYLTAISIMLREAGWAEEAAHFPVVRVLRNQDGTPGLARAFSWRHPGVHALQLPALLVEVNARRRHTPLWVMPRRIGEIQESLRRLSPPVATAAQLAFRLAGGDEAFNAAMVEVGQPPFEPEELALLASLMGLTLPIDALPGGSPDKTAKTVAGGMPHDALGFAAVAGRAFT